jgi:hypothetical protein
MRWPPSANVHRSGPRFRKLVICLNILAWFNVPLAGQNPSACSAATSFAKTFWTKQLAGKQGNEGTANIWVITFAPSLHQSSTDIGCQRVTFSADFWTYGKIALDLQFDSKPSDLPDGMSIGPSTVEFEVVRTNRGDYQVGHLPAFVVTVSTAINMVKERAQRTTDPTEKANADKTLAALQNFAERENRLRKPQVKPR